MRENVAVDSHVLTVFATDTDAGENGRVTYSIKRTYQSDVERVFDINADTGEIKLNKALDYESKASHNLIVVARDNGEPPLESVAFVRVDVIGVNDNRPVIDLIFLTKDQKPKIPEDAKIGEYVARVSVTDPDDDGGGGGGGGGSGSSSSSSSSGAG